MKLEAKLVEALHSNNKAKLESIFKKIYDSYFKLVYFCISAYVNKKEDIEDIVSDTFTVADLGVGLVLPFITIV